MNDVNNFEYAHRSLINTFFSSPNKLGWFVCVCVCEIKPLSRNAIQYRDKLERSRTKSVSIKNLIDDSKNSSYQIYMFHKMDACLRWKEENCQIPASELYWFWNLSLNCNFAQQNNGHFYMRDFVVGNVNCHVGRYAIPWACLE